MKRVKIIKALFVIISFGFSQTFAQSVDDIVAKHIAAMGGDENLSKLKSLKITADMKIMNIEMPVSTIIIQDKAFRTETTAQGMTIIQAVNGNSGWVINPMTGQTKATALPEEAVKSMAGQTDLTGLYHYKEKGYTVTLDGEEDLGGAKVYKMTMTTKTGVKQVNYISKDTFYTLKIVATIPVNGQDITTENVQSDFRQINGLTFPFASEITTTAMPGMAMVNKVATIEVNPKVDERIFAMPE